MKSLFILSLFFVCACSFDNEERTIAFVGDSVVERWGTQEFFPSRKTSNYGKSGSGISYVESFKGRFIGDDVVIISGTNDLVRIGTSNETEYVARYVSAVQQIYAERVYLFSIFPRSFMNDPDSINDKIRHINSLIKKNIASTDIRYIDVFSDLSKGGSIDMQYSYDGLHLNSYGYELICSRLKAVLQ